MAYQISENGVITMFRGDTVEIEVSLVLVDDQGNEIGEEYVMQPGDVLTMTVRQRPGAEYPVEFSVSSDSNRIYISPEDTAGMEVGKYSADIQLVSGGKVMTIFPALDNLTDSQRSRVRAWNNFILTGEVTIDEY